MVNINPLISGASSFSNLAQAKSFLETLQDPRERDIAQAGLLVGANYHGEPQQQVVVLVHGIRTHAEWQEKLRDRLDLDGIRAIPIGYGYLDVFRFLIPVFTRNTPRRRLERELRSIASESRSNVRISVVAHSFGTYLLSKILDDSTDIKLARVVLCGSIIPTGYRWDKVKSRVDSVVNEVGTSDFWPLIAKLVTWGYGESGTTGFKTSFVHDRYHQGGHSDFFSIEYMEKFWLPFIKDGRIIHSDATQNRKVPLWVTPLKFFPLKICVGVVVTTVLLNFFL